MPLWQASWHFLLYLVDLLWWLVAGHLIQRKDPNSSSWCSASRNSMQHWEPTSDTSTCRLCTAYKGTVDLLNVNIHNLVDLFIDSETSIPNTLCGSTFQWFYWKVHIKRLGIRKPGYAVATLEEKFLPKSLCLKIVWHFCKTRFYSAYHLCWKQDFLTPVIIPEM